MAMPVFARTRITVDEFEADPEQPGRYELIDGEVIDRWGPPMVRGVPRACHQRTAFRLARLLADHVDGAGAGEVFVAPFGVVFADGTCVVPDLLFVSRERMWIVTEDEVRGAPDLVVEVLSPGSQTLDTIKKRDLYDRHGVTEYWIVDPEARSVVVLCRDAEGRLSWCQELLAATPDATLGTPLLPGLALPVASLFG